MKFKNIIKDSLLTSSSVGIAAVLSALQAIIVARFLGPESYGVFQLYKMIIMYAGLASFGTYWAMIREISFSVGKKDLKKVDSIKNLTFTFNLLSRFIVVIGILMLFQTMALTRDVGIYDKVLILLIVLMTFLYTFSRQYLVAIKEFATRSLLIVIYPLLNLVFIAPLCFIFGGITGALSSIVVSYLISVGYLFYCGKITVKYYFEKQGILNITKTGGPIFINGCLGMVSNNIDRLLIFGLLPVVQLGYYGVAALIKSFMETLYRAVFLTIFPRLVEKYGETNEPADIQEFVWTPLVISSHICPLIFGTAILVVNPVISLILPKFVDGIYATQIIISSSFFGCIQVGIMNYFITVKKVHTLYVYRIIMICLSAFLIWFTISKGFGIEGVAVSVLCSYVVFSNILVNLFFKNTGMAFSARIKKILFINYPFYYMAIALAIVSMVAVKAEPAVAVLDTATRSIVQVAIYGILNLPILLYLNKKTGVLTEICQYVGDRTNQ